MRTQTQSAITVGFILALALGAAGCASTNASAQVDPPQPPKPTPPQPVVSAARFEKEYVLGVDDQIEVVVQRVPEVSRQVVVRSDGRISLPLLDDVEAAGLTFRALDERLTKLFSARLLTPEVTVIAVRVRQPVVYVAGEVNAGAAVPLHDAPTVAQAIVRAGGFRRSANTLQVTVIRLRADGHLEAIAVNAEGEGEAARFVGLRMMPLQADDIIIVPESGRSQFVRFMEDFVNRPLSGLTSILATYVNWMFIRELAEN